MNISFGRFSSSWVSFLASGICIICCICLLCLSESAIAGTLSTPHETNLNSISMEAVAVADVEEESLEADTDETAKDEFEDMGYEEIPEDEPVFNDDMFLDDGRLIDLDQFDAVNDDGSYPNPLEDNTSNLTVKYVERSEDNILILELLVGQAILDPGILVFLDEDDILLPLSLFSELLEFPINVDTSTGIATGWFISEDRSFDLQYPYKHVTIAGQERAITKGIVEAQIDDIYVSAEVLQEWFPVEFTMNYNQLRLYMEVSENLPFQKRAERRDKWTRAKLQNKPFSRIDNVITLPYHNYSAPVIQLNHGVGFSKTAGDVRSNSSHSVTLQGDLLKMNSRASLNFSTDESGKKEIQNIRFTLSKEDFEAGIGGVLKATSLELGDVSSKSHALAGGNARGRGISLNNDPLNFVRDPNNFIIDGDAPIGWDVEVYQDQRLLDFSNVDDAGRYSFETIPLRQGFNLFRIVLYGPNGEEEERFERFYLGPGMVDTGQFLYSVSALQSSTSLFDVSTNKPAETPHTLSLMGEYGVNKNISVNGSYFRGPFSNDVLNAVQFGAKLSTSSIFTEMSYLRDQGGANSYSVNATGNLSKNISLRAAHVSHSGYVQGTRSMVEISTIGLSQQFSLKLIPSGSYSLEAKREKSDTGAVTNTYSNRFAGTLLGLNLNNQLEYKKFDTGSDPTFTGRLSLRSRIPKGTIRGRVNYTLQGMPVVDSTDIQLQYNISKDLTFNTTLVSAWSAERLSTLTAGLDVKLKNMSLGISGAATTTGDTRFNMTLAYNFIPRSLYGDYELIGATSDLSLGQLMVIPFLDENQNGIKDENEKGLEGVGLKNRLRGFKSITNSEGVSVLAGLSPNVINTIAIDVETLPDVYMKPNVKSLNILGKTGIRGPVYFPVHQLGELSGVLSAEIEDGEVALSNVRMVLLDKDGKAVADTYSEYDGFYIFPSLTMGEYEIFIPYSEDMVQYYKGEGVGPSFILRVEEPEIPYADIIVSVDEIKFK